MKTYKELIETLASANLDKDWVRYTWTTIRAGNTHVKVKDRVVPAQELLDVWYAGASDWEREKLERVRQERTGVGYPEDGSLPNEAGETVGDWLEAMNGGDDTWELEPCGEPTTLTLGKWEEVKASLTDGAVDDLYECAGDIVTQWEISHGELLDREEVFRALDREQVKVTPCTGEYPLYHLYPQQFNPQDAYIRLDPEDAELSADWNVEVGNSIPMAVVHGRVLRYPVSCYLTADEVNALMESLIPLAQRVCDGYSEGWDGHNNVGRLTEDAEQASQEIEAECASAETDSEGPQEEEN